jgi:hypothetical protein
LKKASELQLKEKSSPTYSPHNTRSGLARSKGKRNIMEDSGELSALPAAGDSNNNSQEMNEKKGCCSRADFGFPEANGYAIVSFPTLLSLVSTHNVHISPLHPPNQNSSGPDVVLFLWAMFF